MRISTCAFILILSTASIKALPHTITPEKAVDTLVERYLQETEKCPEALSMLLNHLRTRSHKATRFLSITIFDQLFAADITFIHKITALLTRLGHAVPQATGWPLLTLNGRILFKRAERQIKCVYQQAIPVRV